MTAIRRALQDTLIGARAGRMTSLTQSFTAALAANRLLQPANDSAKAHLLALINTDAGSPGGGHARARAWAAPTCASCAARWRATTCAAADAWLNEARTIGFSGDELDAAEQPTLAAARAKAAQRSRAGRRELAGSASNTWRRNSRRRRATAA